MRGAPIKVVQEMLGHSAILMTMRYAHLAPEVVWETVAVIETWRRHYNEVRPHSSLGYSTPQQFKQNQSPNQSTCERASSAELLVH